MKSILINIIAILIGTSCQVTQKDQQVIGTPTWEVSPPDTVTIFTFNQVQAMYDTLIPIMNGCFITYNSIDTLNYNRISLNSIRDSVWNFFYEDVPVAHVQKWGVIDSTGQVIIPFICDGVAPLSQHQGILSVYLSSFSLNTGIPSYKYLGISYVFNKNGILPDTKNDFEKTIVFIADWHHTQYVISQGHKFYLPDGIQP